MILSPATPPKDRLGPLFDEFKTNHVLATTFYLAMAVEATICGVLVGIQQGARIPPGSMTAKGLNLGLLGTKLTYAIYMTFIIPQVSEQLGGAVHLYMALGSTCPTLESTYIHGFGRVSQQMYQKSCFGLTEPVVAG